MLVFLVGFMGSGKTATGKQLAESLGYPFIDTDQYIEAKYGQAVTQLFEQHGEQQFREYEHQALLDVVQNNTKAIIATGGGLPCFRHNMELITTHGISIYLQASPESLTEWLLQANPQKRPLLHGKTPEELLDFVTRLLEKRKGFYQKALYTVNAELPIAELTNQLVKLVNQLV